MCTYLAVDSQVLRFKGKEKLDPLEIPEKIGTVHTMSALGVLLLAGDKGFEIFDQDFKCIYQ